MRFKEPIPVTTIASLINAELTGNTKGMVTGINEIHKVEAGDLVFVDHPKYYETCLNSPASFIIINKKTEIPEGKTLFIVDEPFEAYLKIIAHYSPFAPSLKMISDTASVGEGSIIMPGVYLGNQVSIGKNCIIHPHVTILDNCVIGNNVIIQSGTVIGSDAFYYNKKINREISYKKMTSCGRVLIEDYAEIGAGCTIDRGVSHDTIIGAGTKFDNLIHVGHDTVIGKNCLLAANVIIAGVVTIKDNVTIWGSVVINKTLTIGENAILLGKTGVVGDLEGNKTYWGTPAQPAGIEQRQLIWNKRIPELWNKVMGKGEKEQ